MSESKALEAKKPHSESTEDKDTPGQPQIVPHTCKKLKGVDIAGYYDGQKTHIVIFRSDVGSGLYLDGLQDDVTPSSNKVIAMSQPTAPWRQADHFCMASKKPYIFRGDEFGVPDDETGFNTYTLHPDNRGGSHYLSYNADPVNHTNRRWIIIFQESGEYRYVEDLEKSSKKNKLEDTYKDGIYFWASGEASAQSVKPVINVLKQVDDWGRLQIFKTTDLSSEDHWQKPFPHHLVPFLPGGTAQFSGPSVGNWTLVKAIENDSPEEMTWSNTVKITVGSNKAVTNTVETKWDVTASLSASVGVSIFSADMSFSASYGGTKSSTQSADWSEQEEIEETLTIKVGARQTMYLWQYCVNKGGELLLYSKELKKTTTHTPPKSSDNPLAEAGDIE